MKRSRIELAKNVIVILIAAIAVFMMIYTLLCVMTVDRKDRSIFGYKFMIVLSDSMSATDFNAGDLIYVKEREFETLKPGDIIAYTSRSVDNYGETIAHKIRSITTDAAGNPGFITYGTTTGADDENIVTESDIIGKYEGKIPVVGQFFSFLKTVPGYMLFILLPFAILIIYEGIHCVKAFREYKEEEITGIAAEREKLKEEREETIRKMKELDVLKAKLEEAGIRYDETEDSVTGEKAADI